MSKRIDGLLAQVAEGFIDGGCLLSNGDWLSENRVTLDECMQLSSLIGVIVHGYVRAPQKIQNRMLLLGATRDEAGLSVDVLLSSLDEVEALREIPEVLRKLG